MHIRCATPGDIAAITLVILASLSEDSSWKSLFTTDFREDPAYDQYAREILKSYLAPENLDWLVFVAEATKGETSTIVSVAIWDLSPSRYHNAGRDSTSTLCDVREVVEVMSPDTNDSVIDKLTALRGIISFSQKQYFQQFEPNVYLEVLATHPAYRGKGYAKALCAVGIESAQKRDLPVTVLASSRGYIFFSGLAFKDLGCVALRATHRSREECVLKAMVLHPRPKKSRSSMVSWFLTHVSVGSSPK